MTGARESLTQFYSVLLKKGLCCFVQSNVQRNIPITVHSRERCTMLQQETDKTDMMQSVWQVSAAPHQSWRGVPSSK